eukprot:TRINITY_DN29107_c0_g1_i1.p1 TRINITY_DN29107_c0_g1~~TRINITY_DN29107_c0_g1_i1.p1  ORF type:complete len:342 (-),score=82.42 TRINITY_DN29107_c0_g1_i1:119-1144(-)
MQQLAADPEEARREFLTPTWRRETSSRSPEAATRRRSKPSLFGTSEDSISWFNSGDWCGVTTACVVWVLEAYAAFIVLWLSLIARTYGWPHVAAFCALCALSLWCHLKVMTTDPGAVPHNARPVAAAEGRCEEGAEEAAVTMCARCDGFKPPRAHHCRVCRRCIVRMDHHCPWVNNCIGALNQKAFILFLAYTLLLSVYGLGLGAAYFYACESGDESCLEHTPTTSTFAPTLLVLSFGALLFTVTMLANQTHSVVKGVGTVDRVQRRRKRQPPHPLTHVERALRWRRVVGTGSKLRWLLPLDIAYSERDAPLLLGYVIPAQLLQRGGGSHAAMAWENGSRD